MLLKKGTGKAHGKYLTTFGKMYQRYPLWKSHKTFWETQISEQEFVDGMWNNDHNIQKVPNLEVYIVNLWPTMEENIPSDHDGQIDRKNDILYHDKTEYDQKVAVLVSGYIDLVKIIRELAIKHIKGEKVAFQKELGDFLKINKAKSEFRTGEQRKYIDLLKGRFDINKVVRIERKDDIHTIANKWADFSSGIIASMRNDGYQESLVELEIEFLVDKVAELENMGILDQGKVTLLENNHWESREITSNLIEKKMLKVDFRKFLMNQH